MLNIFKPIGLTSFDVIKKVRKISGIKKVGHAGTLDPFASGVLLVFLDEETKKVSDFMELKKEYEGVMEFGIMTDTYDSYGKIVERRPVEEYSADFLKNELSSFVGEIEQIPPMYSAVKYFGIPLYKIARRGKEVERRPKKIAIHSLKMLYYSSPFLSIRVSCSKGTYIRSLVFDIGKKLGCGANLKSLTRTRVGDYSIEDSLFLNDLWRYFNNQKCYGSCK